MRLIKQGENFSCATTCLIVVAFLFLLTVTVFGQQRILVGQNVQVSKAHADREHVEVLLAADPNNPSRLLGCAIVRWGEKTVWNKVIAYASFDGGKNWEPVLDGSPDPSMTDPACTYGPDNTAFFVAQGRAKAFVNTGSGGAEKFFGFLYRSRDGGKTWLPPINVDDMDSQFLVTENTKGKYHGRLYIHGAAGIRGIDGVGIPGLTVLHSTDGGATVAPAVKLASNGTNFVICAGPSVVLSDGTLVIPFNELRDLKLYQKVYQPPEPNAWFKVVTSEDGGESLSKAVVVSDWYLRSMSTTNPVPALAVDQSSGVFRDRLYAAWPDVRSGRSEILFSYSADKGKTWSKPVTVNDDWPRLEPGRGPDNFMPTLAVNRDGVVGVMWYDRRDIPDNLGWWARFTASLDGGETFLPSVKVSEAPFSQDMSRELLLHTLQTRSSVLESQIFIGRSQFMGGDYAGLAADANGIFHPFWVDNRTGVAQVWTTTVTVNAKAVRNGSAELSELEDITDKVLIEFTNPRYDRKTNILRVDISLSNTSKDTIAGPIKVRVLSLASEFGKPEIIGADNQVRQAGAVWDFTPLLSNQTLKPGETSKDKHVEFRLTDVRPLRPLRLTDASTNFVTLRTKVLSRSLSASK